MSDGVKIRVVADSATPDLNALLRRTADPRGGLEAVGVAVVSLTKRAFNEASLRESSWAAKKDGSAATLKKDAVLFRSVRVGRATARSVTVESDRPYAAVHQLGGKHMPRRPFMPFSKTGRPTAKADALIREVLTRWIDKRE